MAITVINLTDPVQTLVEKTNAISSDVGDVASLLTSDSNVVDAINTLYLQPPDSAEIRAIAKTAFQSDSDGGILYDSNGTGASSFSLTSTITNLINSKAPIASPTFTGTPAAPTAAAGTNTTQVATTAFVQTAIENYLPSGSILLWYNTIATIPSGWYLCNGQTTPSGKVTPDLRNQFVVAAHSDDASVAKTTIETSANKTGGYKDSIVVYHNHGASSSTSISDPGHIHTTRVYQTQTEVPNVAYGVPVTGGFAYRVIVKTASNTGGRASDPASTGISASTSTGINYEGSSGTNRNLPPYYALAYIMKD